MTYLANETIYMDTKAAVPVKKFAVAAGCGLVGISAGGKVFRPAARSYGEGSI